MKNVGIILIAIAMLGAASCKKKIDIALDKQQNKMLGTWTIASINIHQTDTMGVLVIDSTITAPGTIEFIAGNINATGTDSFFNEAHFIGPCINANLVDYFRAQRAGDAIGTTGWSLFWDADPDGLRVQFWGVLPNGSLHRSINLGSSAGSTELYYFIDEPVNNRRTMYTWRIHK